MNSKPYEKPTDELRQVKRPIKRGYGVFGTSYREEIIGYDTTVQRKWIITTQSMGTGSRLGYVDSVDRDEWRDIETIWTEKPQGTAQ